LLAADSEGTVVTDSTAKKSADKAEVKPEPAPRVALARAAESGDAGVQILVAKREIHASNGDTAKVAELDADLAELGFTV
jgi:hypothetical protein